MILFVDTSALAKRYIEEKGSEDIDELFLLAKQIMVSSVTAIEFTSALSRRLREKSIDEQFYNDALKMFEKERSHFTIIPFDTGIEKTALINVKKHGMKTLDSIQLASAIKSGSDYMVMSDHKLHAIAIIEYKGNAVLIG